MPLQKSKIPQQNLHLPQFNHVIFSHCVKKSYGKIITARSSYGEVFKTRQRVGEVSPR
jgi:hypothetical protein